MTYQFRIGERVVCVNDKFPGIKTDQQLREGQEYTVRHAGTFTHYLDGTYYGLKLFEIDRGQDNDADGFGYDDMPFRAYRFRPLVEPKTTTTTKIEETA
ncbi:CAP-Gly domain protein [Rhizobium sp. 16-449-1b]|uniref:CAP-Gly domain protein n=1 Tax=Rhizobium sp. 16-449-1b TaxID=2819989 RepID=UPI001ADACF05|nr:CAP-Gly domain protein [Rhizobium sp. 16-449-1b]MBO9194299.1 CAP-Gly domain protein [Rhizobium sp. 16-449-1b]